MSETISIYFFRGYGLVPILVRFFSRADRQPWATVPAHVGIALRDCYYEATITGVHSQPVTPELIASFVLTTSPITVVTDAANRVEAFLKTTVGKRYDFFAPALDLIAHFVPWQLPPDQTTRIWDCSRLAAWALNLAGCRLPARRAPLSPNDLYLILSGGK